MSVATDYVCKCKLCTVRIRYDKVLSESFGSVRYVVCDADDPATILLDNDGLGYKSTNIAERSTKSSQNAMVRADGTIGPPSRKNNEPSLISRQVLNYCRFKKVVLDDETRFFVVDIVDQDRIISDNNGLGFKSIDCGRDEMKGLWRKIFQQDRVLSQSEYRAFAAKRKQDAEVTVKQRRQDVLDFQLPEAAALESLAESVCQTLFDRVSVIYDWVSDDCPWDRSGRVVRMCPEALEDLLLASEGTSDFLDSLYTGESRASYCSGCGLFFQTFKETFESKIKDLLEKQYPLIFNCIPDTEEEDEFYEQLMYCADVENKQIEMEDAIMEICTDYLEKQSLDRFLPTVRNIVGKYYP